MTNLNPTSTLPRSLSLNTSKLVQSNTVSSQDGTKINYLTVGSGLPVIVIPGALSIAANYRAFAEALSLYFAVHIIERRGRGLSGPQGADYSIAKECEDMQAVQRRTGAAFIVGHSFGGLVALEFARNNPALTKIAVYEPGVSVNGSISMDWIPAYKKALANHKYSDAFTEFVMATGPEGARKTPRWLMRLLLPLLMDSKERQQRLSLLPENLREHEEVGRLDNNYRNYRAISAPALLMYGGKADIDWVTPTMNKLAEVLPQSQLTKFPRLDHFGIDKGAPQEVAQAVSDYFLSNDKAD